MNAPPDVSARVARLHELGPHRSAWDELVAESRHPTPFVTSWWLEAGGPTARHLLLVFAGETLIGGLALSRRKRGGIARLRIPGSSFSAPDHVDVLARPGHEDEVVDGLRRWFDGCGPYLFDGAGIPSDSLLQRVFADACTVVPFSAAPYLSLDPSTPPVALSGRLRSTIKRAEKRLAHSDLMYRRVPGTAGDFEPALESLVRMHRARWPGGSRFLTGLARLLPVLRAGGDSVEIHELLVEGRVVANMLAFIASDRLFYYQSGRDPAHELRGSGSVLMGRVITDAHARGFREFDFLRGAEPYKFDWTAQQRPLVRLIAARGTVARTARVALLAVERAKPALRRVRGMVRRIAAE